MCLRGIFTFNLLVTLMAKLETGTVLKCTEEFCEEYQAQIGCSDISAACKNMNSTHNGIFLRYPDSCNCCQHCLTNLQEEDECEIGFPGLPPPTDICGPTLTCTTLGDRSSTCQRMKSSCFLAQDDYDKRKLKGLLGMTEVRPKCNGDGFYEPYHCIPGSICYCVSPDGQRIFGELPFVNFETEKQMSCGCSLTAWKASNSLLYGTGIPVVRCTESGLYDPLQCTMGANPYCYCIDSITGNFNYDSEVVPESNVDKLPCFDASHHSKEGFTSECERLHKMSSNFQDSHLENHCQADGKFSRIQYFGSKKICVDPVGKRIENFEASEGTMEAKVMNCNCARTRWILAKSGQHTLPNCCPFGNFESWQCHQQYCFCVDQNGNQLGLEVPQDKISTLSCYQKNKGNPCFVQ